MSLSINPSWFAVQVVPQHERHVAVSLEHKGYEHFVPTYLTYRTWCDRKKPVRSPLFPGYVFFRAREHSLGLVCTTPSVIRILGGRAGPCAIPDEEVETVQKITAVRAETCPCAFRPNLGDRVKVIKGVLSGICGELVSIENKRRLVVSIELAMSSISVDVDCGDVCRISDSERHSSMLTLERHAS